LLTEEMVLMLAPNEDMETSSTFGANMFSGFNEPKRQKFAAGQLWTAKYNLCYFSKAG
jgi:hypothetical protein